MMRRIVCGMLAAGLFASLVLLTAFFLERVPPVIDVHFSSDNAPTMAQAHESGLAAAAREELSVRRPGQSAETQVLGVYVLPQTGAGLSLRFSTGEWFDQQAFEQDQSFAILPRSLALQLFSAEDIVGAWVEIDGVSYQVAGVYIDGSTLWEQIARGPLSSVYLTRLPHSAPEEILAEQTFLFPSETESAAALLDALSYSPVVSFDLRNARTFAQSLVWLSVLGAMMVPVIAVLRWSSAQVLGLYTTFVSEGVISIRAWLRAGGGALGFAGAFTAFGAVCSQLDFPRSWLPEQNLFEMGHYTASLVSFYQQLAGVGPAFAAEHLTGGFLPFLTVVSVIFLLCIWLPCWQTNKHWR